MALVLGSWFGAHAGIPSPLFVADPEYLVRGWEVEDGLPENSATAMVQAPDGYLWFGTFNGLVRFNGTDFKVLTPLNTPGLPSQAIVNLHLDKAGRLFVSTYDGLAVREGGKWRRLQPAPGQPEDFVRTFTERQNGDLLLTLFNGAILEYSRGVLTRLASPPGQQGRGYFGGVDEDGYWWVAQNKFIGRMEDGKWVQKIVPTELPGDAFAMAPARGGGIWLLMGAEVLKLRRGAEVSRIRIPQFPGGVWSMSEDSRGNIWIAGYHTGFWRLAPDGTLANWKGVHGWSDGGRFVFEDREGNLWAGTSGDGLLRLVPRQFQHVGLAGAPKALVVQSVAASQKGGVLAATYGWGLHHLESLTNAAHAELGMDTPYLQSVHEDRLGRLWLGTLNSGVRVIREQSARSVAVDLPRAVGSNVVALMEDSRGGIWLSSGKDAVGRLDGDDLQVFGAAEGLVKGAPTSFAEQQGIVWGANGMAVFRLEDGRRFREVRDEAGQPITGVQCLSAGGDGAIWMGTHNRGLLRWEKARLTQVDGEAGLPMEEIRGLVEDTHGYCWIMFRHRIVRAALTDLEAVANRRAMGMGDQAEQRASGSVPYQRLDCQVFDVSDGLPKADFTGGRQPNCARDTEGRLWFATTKGLVTVDPANLRRNENVPPVYIEEISFQEPGSKAEKEVRRQIARPFPDRVVLSAGCNGLQIHYAGLSFTAPEKIRHQFMLEGYSDSWQDVGPRRVAYYQQLRPGDYVFRVRAANNDGVWNQTGTSLGFSVLPFYWQTAWFRFGAGALLAAAGAAATWLWSRNHVRRALEREKVANQIRDLAGQLITAQESERRRIARELHDDFSQRLALLSIEMELLRSKDNEESGPRLEQMTNRVKELSSEVHRLAYELHPAKLDQLGLIAAARGFCREQGEQRGMQIEFLVTGEVPGDLPDEIKLCAYRIIQESLQNVIRHSGVKEARVELRIERDKLCLSICDAGVGFEMERARQRGSLGLSSMEERVRLVHGELLINSKPGSGTQIEVKLPLKVSRGVGTILQ